MPTCKDFEFIGNRYVNIKEPDATCGERMWYDRTDIEPFEYKTPTECVICIEAENEMYTKYAHPKAHLEAHTQAEANAIMLTNNQSKEDYIDYYTFYYGREYKKIYTELSKKYKWEYYVIVLEREYKDAKICQHHSECIQYHYELE